MSPIHETLEPATDETQALVLQRTTPARALGQMAVFLVHLYILYTLAFMLCFFPAHRRCGRFSRLAVVAVRTRYALWRLMATGWNE